MSQERADKLIERAAELGTGISPERDLWPDIAAADKALHEVAGEIHEALVGWLAALLAVHVGAALWHHFARRDAVLTRMLRGQP